MKPMRFPMVMQATQSECGLACASMVLNYFGCEIPMSELRSRQPVGRDGLSLLALKNLLGEYGFQARGVRLVHASDAENLQTPAIVHWDGAHFVVVTSVGKHKVRLVDPATGHRQVSRSEFEASASGACLEVTKTSSSVRRRRPRFALLRYMAGYMHNLRSHVWLLIGAILGISAITLMPAALTSYVIDEVIPHRLTSVGGSIALGIVLMGVSYLLVTLLRSYVIIRLEKIIDYRGSTELFSHLIRLPYAFFFGRPVGDLLLRFASIAQIRDAFTSRLIPLIIDVSLFATYFLIIASWSSTYATALMVIMVLLAVLVSVYAPIGKRLADMEIQMRSASQSATVDAISGIENVKAMGNEDSLLGTWNSALVGELRSSSLRSRVDAVFSALVGTVSFICAPGLVFLGYQQVIAGQLSLGEMMALNAICMSALSPLTNIGMGLQVLLMTRIHLLRIRDILDEPLEEMNNDGVLVDERITSIEFDHVSFAFGGSEHPIVDDVSFKVMEGETIAIVGPTGSGKSTIGRLLCGLLKPTGGTIRVNGIAMDDLFLDSFRRKVGVVSQGVTAAQGNILSNVQSGRPDIDESAAIKALETAALLPDVRRMPLGIYTPLAENGAGLSGGQLQRLVLARAIAHEPDLLILDEATSSVDAATEREILARLQARPMIKLMISHNQSTIMQADRIFRIEQGQLQIDSTDAQVDEMSVR